MGKYADMLKGWDEGGDETAKKDSPPRRVKQGDKGEPEKKVSLGDLLRQKKDYER